MTMLSSSNGRKTFPRTRSRGRGRLSAVLDVQLHEDAFQVSLDRPLRNRERITNLTIRVSFDERFQHDELAFRQLGRRKAVRESPGRSAGDNALTGGGAADR